MSSGPNTRDNAVSRRLSRVLRYPDNALEMLNIDLRQTDGWVPVQALLDAQCIHSAPPNGLANWVPGMPTCV